MAYLDLTHICRICLTEHEDMQRAVKNVLNKLIDCASVQLPPDSLICAFCKTQIDKWYSFKQQVIRSTEVIKCIEESRVKKEVSKNRSKLEAIGVKEEINVGDTFQEEETQ